MNTHRYIVRRASFDEFTCAIVDLTSEKENKLDTFHSLKRALSKWGKTEEGGEAWEEAGGGDFNIGDLSHHEGEVVPFLEAEGIMEMEIEIISHTDPESPYWGYDTALMEEMDEEEEEE